MKKLSIIALLAITTGLVSFTAKMKSTWNYDNAHAKIGFTVSHMTLSDVDGYFKDVEATITAPNDDLSDAEATFTAKVNSVNTDNTKRDEHLQSKDFFDAASYPTITFKSTSFTKTKVKNAYVINGDLTMHGITKKVSFAAIIKTGLNPYSKKSTAGFKVTGKLNRKDFKIGEGTPNAMVGDVINVNVNAEFIKADDQK